MAEHSATNRIGRQTNLLLSARARLIRRILGLIGHTILILITSASALAVFFIFIYIGKDALPFFGIHVEYLWDGAADMLGGALGLLRGDVTGFRESLGEFAEAIGRFRDGLSFTYTRGRLTEFFTGIDWYPSREPGEFGAASIFVGSAMVTLGAIIFAVPVGVSAAVCLSDVLPFKLRQYTKPIIEVLAAIPSVAYGFFAAVVFGPQLLRRGGTLLEIPVWALGVPLTVIISVVLGDLLTSKVDLNKRRVAKTLVTILALCMFGAGLWWLGSAIRGLQFNSGQNALNASIILGIMALPTVVSVSEDALQAVGRDLRAGSYALGSTRAETMMRVVLPAASSGICAAVILGVMRAIGETMVVWMASGNALQPRADWFNFTLPVRTLTASIAADMGEADQVIGSQRYHVLFAMALALLSFCFVCNLISEWAVHRTRKKLAGE